MKPSEWAEKYFHLDERGNAELFEMSRTPYLRGIVDSVLEPGVEDIVFIKPTRVGGTTAGNILLGYWIDCDPGPCLNVSPNEDDSDKLVKDVLRPTFERSPAIARHLPTDRSANTLKAIEFDSMTVRFAYSGSVASLGAMTCRYVKLDETDKYEEGGVKEADPIRLAKERTGSFKHRKRHYITSTPTARDGFIFQAWESCGDKRHFFVKCPHADCQRYQRLVWGNVHWDKTGLKDDEGKSLFLTTEQRIAIADRIIQYGQAWYTCEHCQKQIFERHKPDMLDTGVWLSQTQSFDENNVLHGERPFATRIGFQISALYSNLRTFAEMAAEFILAEGDATATMNFYNSRLGEIYEQIVSVRAPNVIRAKRERAVMLGEAGLPRIMPKWATLMFASADVQKNMLYYTIEAWGYGQKSKRVLADTASTLDELYSKIFDPHSFPIQHERGGEAFNAFLLIDANYRRDDVMALARRFPAQIFPTRGLSTYESITPATYKHDNKTGVQEWSINTLRSKDLLDSLVGKNTDSPDPSDEVWQVYSGISDEFCNQMTSEHKIWDRKAKLHLWKPKTSGARNHWWDCCANAAAVAEAMGASMPSPTRKSQVQSPPMVSPDRSEASTQQPSVMRVQQISSRANVGSQVKRPGFLPGSLRR